MQLKLFYDLVVAAEAVLSVSSVPVVEFKIDTVFFLPVLLVLESLSSYLCLSL